MKVKIIADSACDLPEEIIDKYDIDLLPIVIINGDREYLDRVSIDAKEVYDNMRRGETYKTSQIPPNLFNEKFRYYAEKGQDTIYIGFSSGLSGTYQSAAIVGENIRKDYKKFNLDIVDSKAASIGCGLLVYQVARLADEGFSREKILDYISNNNNIEHVFTVDNIDYLFRGGRVTKTQALLGGLLNIKPTFDMKDGKLVNIDKVRGRKKAIKNMLKLIEEKSYDINLKETCVGICHGDDLEGALILQEMIKEKFGCKDFIVNIVGPTIGAHTGPGMLGVSFLKGKQK